MEFEDALVVKDKKAIFLKVTLRVTTVVLDQAGIKYKQDGSQVGQPIIMLIPSVNFLT